MNNIPLDRDNYSESSKRSVGFEYLGGFYASINYRCKKCYQSAIFTAIEQKESFEIKKKYMWQKRLLCNKCHKEMYLVKKELLDIYSSYCCNKKTLLMDEVFLSRWLLLLNEYPKYAQKGNPSRVKFVTKALNIPNKKINKDT